MHTVGCITGLSVEWLRNETAGNTQREHEARRVPGW